MRALPALVLSAALVAPAAALAQQPKAVTVVVGTSECARLVRHVPADDVAYKPGVDAYGRTVAPADLPGTQVIKAPDRITINLSIDTMRAFGITDSSGLLKSEASVGQVTYDINSGKLAFNGQPLTDPEAAALAAGCRSAATK
jgi:hypothetical protein